MFIVGVLIISAIICIPLFSAFSAINNFCGCFLSDFNKQVNFKILYKAGEIKIYEKLL